MGCSAGDQAIEQILKLHSNSTALKDKLTTMCATCRSDSSSDNFTKELETIEEALASVGWNLGKAENALGVMAHQKL